MTLQLSFRTPLEKYNEDGFNIDSGLLFVDTVYEWEVQFHERFPHCFANFLIANMLSMSLLDKCMEDQADKCGFELINGQVDLETWFKMDEHSEWGTIYAIGSQIKENMDEPIFLVIDDGLTDGVFVLKYMPEDDEEGEEVPPVPEEEILINPGFSTPRGGQLSVHRSEPVLLMPQLNY